jgi:proteic killer suppression protein
MGTIRCVWEIYEHRRVERQLALLPREILKRYEKWKDIATMSGPVGIRLIKGFHDETLLGEWRGHRSSRLGLQYRVIYSVRSAESIFTVMSITPHDYRRT